MYELIKKARRREAEKRLRLDRWVREGAEKTRQEDIFFIITWQMHFFLRLSKIEHLFLKLKQPTILISSEVLNGVKSHRKR
jgi:hypothetical protein